MYLISSFKCIIFVLMYKKYISQKKIAELFGYSNVKSFYNSSARDRVMKGINELITIIDSKNEEKLELLRDESLWFKSKMVRLQEAVDELLKDYKQ